MRLKRLATFHSHSLLLFTLWLTTPPSLKSPLDASRGLIPATKTDSGGEQQHYLKQVCIYAFPLEQLKAFSDAGQKSPLESREDIEILRFVEMGQTVRMLKSSATSVAVDEPQDVETAERIMRGLGLTPLR